MPRPMSEQTGSRRIKMVEVTFEDGSTAQFFGRGTLTCYSAIQQQDVPQRVDEPKQKVQSTRTTVDILQLSMLLLDPEASAPQEPPGAEEG